MKKMALTKVLVSSNWHRVIWCRDPGGHLEISQV